MVPMARYWEKDEAPSTDAPRGRRGRSYSCGHGLLLQHAATTPLLCLKCSHTGVIGAHTVRSKEVTPELVRLVSKDIANMGHNHIVLKREKEPVMKPMAGRLKGVTQFTPFLSKSYRVRTDIHRFGRAGRADNPRDDQHAQEYIESSDVGASVR